MLKRNKLPPPSPRHQPFTSLLQPQPQITSQFRHQVLSPNPPISRLQRKREDSAAKSSSLNSKLLRKNVERRNGRDDDVEKNEQRINCDYFPSNQEPLKAEKASKGGMGPKGNLQQLPAFESAPNLQTQELWEKRQHEEMSTELSKHSDYVEPLKQVKFGGVIEETEKTNMKKREKVRSPSILKNSSRNILNGSLISGSKERERSCSVASGKDRNQRQKVANQNNTNKIIKQKYKSILSKLQAQSTGNYTRGNRFSGAVYNNAAQKQKIASPYKYKDEIFPPVYSSLFQGKKGRLKVGEEISWIRVGDLFKDKELTLAKTFKSNLQVTKSQESFAEDYFVGALNSIMGSSRLLQKIFEDQDVNPYGIYILKIYQENVWKYIIIDDYIPVIKNKNGAMEPAFINVHIPKDDPVDIWPFLLEKAYANYYSRYEALQHGNIVEFAEEISGSPSRKIQLKSQSHRKKEKISEEDMEKSLQKMKKELRAGENVAIGQLFADKGYISLMYNIYSQTLFYNDPYDNFKRKAISFQNLVELCRSAHLISPFKYNVSSTTVIRKGRPTAGKQHPQGYFEADQPSVRIFKVEEPSQFAITLRQREKRLYHLKEDYGEYIWCRFILLQREMDHGFRWISGQYNQKKSINFTQCLEAGEYWLLIEPQWRINSPNEIILQLFGQREYDFQRVAYKQDDRVLQSGCLDLAQRYGELNQINKFICSYNYVTEKVGLIIENIVNERVNGDVTVMRSIRGLKCKVQILPINKEFYEQAEVKGEKLMKLKEEIELDIPKGQHFTVVLKLKGGIDRKFFKSFDFGC